MTQNIKALIFLLLISVPGITQAMSLHLVNNTESVAEFSIYRDELVIAKIPPLLPGQYINVPTDGDFEITATTQIYGQLYTTKPQPLTAEATFSGVVVPGHQMGEFDFNLTSSSATDFDQLALVNTFKSAMKFTITKDGRPFQTLVVEPGQTTVLSTRNLYHIVARVDGFSIEAAIPIFPDAKVTLSPGQNGSDLYTLWPE